MIAPVGWASVLWKWALLISWALPVSAGFGVIVAMSNRPIWLGCLSLLAMLIVIGCGWLAIAALDRALLGSGHRQLSRGLVVGVLLRAFVQPLLMVDFFVGKRATLLVDGIVDSARRAGLSWLDQRPLEIALVTAVAFAINFGLAIVAGLVTWPLWNRLPRWWARWQERRHAR